MPVAVLTPKCHCEHEMNKAGNTWHGVYHIVSTQHDILISILSSLPPYPTQNLFYRWEMFSSWSNYMSSANSSPAPILCRPNAQSSSSWSEPLSVCFDHRSTGFQTEAKFVKTTASCNRHFQLGAKVFDFCMVITMAASHNL